MGLLTPHGTFIDFFLSTEYCRTFFVGNRKPSCVLGLEIVLLSSLLTGTFSDMTG